MRSGMAQSWPNAAEPTLGAMRVDRSRKGREASNDQASRVFTPEDSEGAAYPAEAEVARSNRAGRILRTG